MIIIPNVDKENSCLNCLVWSLCWDDKPTEDICKDRCPIVEPKRGGWIDCGWSIKCSECGYNMPFSTRNYCPNCGAKMESEGNE